MTLGSIQHLHIATRLRLIRNNLNELGALSQTLRHCPACEHKFLTPCPNIDQLRVHYSISSNLHGTSTLRSYLERIRNPDNLQNMNSLLDILEDDFDLSRLELKSGFIADIGCNAATNLAALKQSGYTNLLAIEPDPRLQEWNARYVGCSCVLGMIDDISTSYFGECTLVILHDVLEHVIDVRHALKICYELMSQNSALSIQVPNMDCILGKYNLEAFSWYEVDHLHYFNQTSLRKLIESTGFRKIRITTPITPFYDANDFKQVFRKDLTDEDAKKIEATLGGRRLHAIVAK